MSEILPKYKYLFKKPIDVLLAQYKEDILRAAADVWESEGYSREEISKKWDELSDTLASAKKPAFIAMYQFYKEKKHQPITMKDAGAFDISNSTGLLVPTSETNLLVNFKQWDKYDPNSKGHRPNLSQPSKTVNKVPIKHIPDPFGIADDYEPMNLDMKTFDLGTSDYDIHRVRGFKDALAEIRNKMAEENIHGIVVTIPKSELTNLKKEEEFLEENEGTQFWNLKKNPSNLNIGDRIYFVENGYITYYQIIDDIVNDMHCDVTDRDWTGTNLILSKEIYNLETAIPYKGFQGFRYINDELKNKLRQASILDYPKPGLCPSIWDENGKMLTVVKDQIINKLLKFFKSQDIDLLDKDIVSKIMVIGSLTSYQYASNSDLDCHIHLSIDKILDAFNLPEEELVELIDSKWRKELNNLDAEVIHDTKHPLEFYFEMEGFTTAEPTDGVYDLFADNWIKEPRTVDIDFDINEKYPEIIEYANTLAKEIDGEIGDIDRDIKDIQLLQETIQAFPKPKQKLFLDKLQNKIAEIDTDIQDLLNKGTKIIKDRKTKYNPYSKENITFKFFQRYLYLNLFSDIKKALKDETDIVKVDTIEDVNKIKDVVDEFQEQT